MWLVCQHIAMNARDAIEKGDFEEDISGMGAIHAILVEIRNSLHYRRQRRNKGIKYTQ